MHGSGTLGESWSTHSGKEKPHLGYEPGTFLLWGNTVNPYSTVPCISSSGLLFVGDPQYHVGQCDKHRHKANESMKGRCAVTWYDVKF